MAFLCLVGEVVKTLLDGRVELVVLVVIGGTQAVALDELPDPFDQVQVRRVRRQVQHFYVQLLRQVCHQRALLVCRVVQYKGYRHSWDCCCRHDSQQVAHRMRIDVTVIGHRDQFVSDRIQCRQNVERGLSQPL